MKINNLRFFSATTEEDFENNTPLACSVVLDDFSYEVATSNTTALAKVYNKAIDKALNDDVDCLVLVHDDVVIDDPSDIFLQKMEKLFDSYDLVGLAGASTVEIKEPTLWHVMGGGFQSGNLHGCVYHWHKEEGSYKMWRRPSNFGPYPHRVVMIDGLFIALNRKMIESSLAFDENCPSDFHLYDLIYSLSAHNAGMRVGVGDIEVTHASPGLREFTEDFLKGQKYFMNKFGKSKNEEDLIDKVNKML